MTRAAPAARRPAARVLGGVAQRHRGAFWTVTVLTVAAGAVAWHFGSWAPLVALAGALAFEGTRLAAEAWGWQRAGGRAELRRRRRSSGPAPMHELAAHLGLRAARRTARNLRPSLAGRRLATIPAHDAGICLGTARRAAR